MPGREGFEDKCFYFEYRVLFDVKIEDLCTCNVVAGLQHRGHVLLRHLEHLQQGVQEHLHTARLLQHQVQAQILSNLVE